MEIARKMLNEGIDLEDDIAYWIEEVESELREIDRQQHQLLRQRTKYEGTLLWLKNLLKCDA